MQHSRPPTFSSHNSWSFDFQNEFSTQKRLSEMPSINPLKKFLKWLRNGDELQFENAKNPKLRKIWFFWKCLDFWFDSHSETLDMLILT